MSRLFLIHGGGDARRDTDADNVVFVVRFGRLRDGSVENGRRRLRDPVGDNVSRVTSHVPRPASGATSVAVLVSGTRRAVVSYA